MDGCYACIFELTQEVYFYDNQASFVVFWRNDNFFPSSSRCKINLASIWYWLLAPEEKTKKSKEFATYRYWTRVTREYRLLMLENILLTCSWKYCFHTVRSPESQLLIQNSMMKNCRLLLHLSRITNSRNECNLGCSLCTQIDGLEKITWWIEHEFEKWTRKFDNYTVCSKKV